MTSLAAPAPPPPPSAPRAGAAGLQPARLPPLELLGAALQGLRTRRLRAALSALGIAIGIGAMVAVVGVSASAQANLLAEISALGTNLLTVTPGQPFLGTGEAAQGPMAAAIANAVQNATGVRLRDLPLSAERVKAGIGV